ncbi:MAG: transposase [Candidatus Cloacimonadota bacterium]|nr:transposase [Candidatus Cloacimonadota bacterium]
MIKRKANRYIKYDYSQNGYYFVTICTKGRLEYFGKIQNGNMIMNEFGKVVEQRWLWLQDHFDYVRCGEFVVMPNHFHGILIIDSIVGTGRDLSFNPSNHPSNNNGTDNDPKGNNIIRTGHNLSLQKIKSLSELIGAFKTTSSKLIHQSGLKEFRWQRSFYDHIIRDEKSLQNIVQYIKDNSGNWEIDEDNIMKQGKK